MRNSEKHPWFVDRVQCFFLRQESIYPLYLQVSCFRFTLDLLWPSGKLTVQSPTGMQSGSQMSNRWNREPADCVLLQCCEWIEPLFIWAVRWLKQAELSPGVRWVIKRLVSGVNSISHLGDNWHHRAPSIPLADCLNK